MEPLAVSSKDAARLLSVSERTVRRYCAKGQIRVVRVGRRVLVPLAELERLVRQGTDNELGRSMGAGEEVACDPETNPGSVSGRSQPGGADGSREPQPAPAQQSAPIKRPQRGGET